MGLQGVVHGAQPPITGAELDHALGGGVDRGWVCRRSAGDDKHKLQWRLHSGELHLPGFRPIRLSDGVRWHPGLAPLTNNTAILMLAALTDCNTLKANATTTFVFVDEVTTMGAVAALSPT